MKFEIREVVRHPRAKVYEALRDQMTRLTRYLPGIDSIVEREREEIGPGQQRIVTHWQANTRAAPRAVRPFLRPSMTQWQDVATWDDEASCVHWCFETSFLESIYSCEGTNYIEDGPSGETVLRLTGDLVVHLNKIPGLPKRFVRKLGPRVESYLIDQVIPNLKEVPSAVQTFLDQA
jgi:hypothetical protein